jgi:hypothetical protein
MWLSSQRCGTSESDHRSTSQQLVLMLLGAV